MSDWIEYLTRGRATDMPGVMKASEAIGAFLGGLIATRRVEAPVDDVLGMLPESKIDGRLFTDEEILRTRSEEHTSELQSLMRISYAVFCLKKKKTKNIENTINQTMHKNSGEHRSTPHIIYNI